VVDAAAAAILAAPDLYEAWLRPVQDALDPVIEALATDPASSGNSAGTREPRITRIARRAIEDLLESIPSIYRAMDTGSIEEAIARAMFAGDANGRLERVAILPDTVALADPASSGNSAGTSVPDFMTEPEDFNAAVAWFDSKVTAPTSMRASEIALKVPGAIRMQAFFSARVASTNILESMRQECRDILEGKRNVTQAAARLREFLAKEGYGIPRPKRKGDADLTTLASDRRLRLVLRQNVAMAQAVGRRSVSEHPEVTELFPNYRYSANTARHAQFDGLVLPKSDPFWDTHYPPWDYECKCLIYDTDAPAARGVQRVRNVPPARSGFVFESRPAVAFRQPDPAIVDDELLRRIFADELTEKERELLEKMAA